MWLTVFCVLVVFWCLTCLDSLNKKKYNCTVEDDWCYILSRGSLLDKVGFIVAYLPLLVILYLTKLIFWLKGE